jgi:hypothetical protein
MNPLIIQLRPQLIGCMAWARIFPRDERRERFIIGIHPYEAMPECVNGYDPYRVSQWACHMKRFVNRLRNLLDKHIRVGRDLAF